MVFTLKSLVVRLWQTLRQLSGESWKITGKTGWKQSITAEKDGGLGGGRGKEREWYWQREHGTRLV
ncbi:hypothetical protein E2C01_027228 [Portunus trituberculatus]|uniref:Uncharacterized protein n=1 Tax=Portunus trituberculatus TaxID=210409 RepID=A0A5B7EHM4_PORTR|nr:hypothetical protein [Portunus trituberculatus]